MRSLKSQNPDIYGFRLDAAGAHSARTIMVPELDLLLVAGGKDTITFDEYSRVILNENCLQKRSASNRKYTLDNLRILYGLDDRIPIFRILKILWAKDPGSLPRLAFLCAAARDRLLRELSPWMISHPEGSSVLRTELEEQIQQSYPDRFSARTLTSTSQNLNASWAQAGYTKGRISKIRIKSKPGPAAVCYALLLAYLMGERGICLFESEYALLLDSPTEELFSWAEIASRKGWIRMKRIGEVVDISFDPLWAEAELTDVQD